MTVEKTIFGKIDMPYSMMKFTMDGTAYAISASEAREGEILLVDLDHDVKKKVVGLAGGSMGIVKVPGERNKFFAIQKFYPVFQSEQAEVICFALEDLEQDVCTAKILAKVDLPFVHRISVDRVGETVRLIGATLCRSKAFTEDWSTAGFVCSYEVDKEMHISEPVMLIPEIHKNHGMVTDTDGMIYVSGEEGIWKIYPDNRVEKVNECPVGDLCLYDVDGDGEKEILCISPFHGDRVKVLKENGGAWNVCGETAITFGHALWCGKCGNETGLLVCERGNEKKIRRYSVSADGTLNDRGEIEAGTGTTNFVVEETADGLEILAANHAVGEVAGYNVCFG